MDAGGVAAVTARSLGLIARDGLNHRPCLTTLRHAYISHVWIRARAARRVDARCAAHDTDRTTTGATRAARGVGRHGGEHRLAVAPRSRHVVAASGAARDPQQGGRAPSQRDHLPDPAGHGRSIQLSDRAVVGVSDRAAGASAGAGVGSARLRGRGSAQARPRAPRVAQPVSCSLCKTAERGGAHAREQDESVTRQAVRQLPLDGSR